MDRRRFTLCAALGAWLPMVQAAPGGAPRRYAVLSLVGDALNIVHFQVTTGSRVDQNRRQVVKLADGSFDHVVLGAAQEALKSADPDSTAALFVGTPEAYAGQADLISGGRLAAPAWLAATLQKESCSHLVLFTKHIAAAEFKTYHGRFGGNGSLTGLGFYIDQSTPSERVDTGQGGRGFIAPYLYVKLALVEVATGQLLGQQFVASGILISSANNETGVDPWGALSAEQKVSLLDDIIKQDIPKAVTALVCA